MKHACRARWRTVSSQCTCSELDVLDGGSSIEDTVQVSSVPRQGSGKQDASGETGCHYHSGWIQRLQGTSARTPAEVHQRQWLSVTLTWTQCQGQDQGLADCVIYKCTWQIVRNISNKKLITRWEYPNVKWCRPISSYLFTYAYPQITTEPEPA